MTNEQEPTIQQRLVAPFPPEEIKQRPGRGSMTFSYVDAPAVMHRLDEVVGLQNWQTTFQVINLAESVVECTLQVRIDGEWITKTDAGYPNSDNDDEPLKSAYSDALKRAAVQFGIGRHLREKTQPQQRQPQRPVQAAQAPSAPAAVPGAPMPGVTMVNGDGSLNFTEFWAACRRHNIDNTAVAKEVGGDLNNLKTMSASAAVDVFNLLRDRQREAVTA